MVNVEFCGFIYLPSWINKWQMMIIFQALKKMKQDWKTMNFTFVPYKDTNLSILSSPDDIQVLLEDHIVKTTTMKGSPFIGPFEEEVNQWDITLVSLAISTLSAKSDNFIKNMIWDFLQILSLADKWH